MLRIRLSRFGTNKRPTYRLIVSERQKDTHGDVLEYVGSYNPRTNPKQIQLQTDRIEHWLSKGAQPSPTVHNLLVDQGIIKAKKVHAFRVPKKPVEAPAPAATPVAAETAPVETPAAEAVGTPEATVKPAAEVPAAETATETPAAPAEPAPAAPTVE